MTSLPDATVRALTRRLAGAQRQGRLPSLVAAVHRDGDEVFAQRGSDPSTQYRIGSISKPFTAVLVMQLRDEGRLRLDDPLDAHLPGTPTGAATIGELLAHRSGLRREPPGDFWEATPGQAPQALLERLRAEDVAPEAHGVHHYSNLGYGLLGLVVERLRGLPWVEALDRHVLRPLELRDTTYLPRPPYATGLRVHPLDDHVIEEPAHDARTMAPAGQLWSTPADLCRFGSFLADPCAEVLAPATVEEMARPAVVVDPAAWTAGYGLGLQLTRRGDRVFAGHGGSMPGFLANLAVHRSSGVVAAFCTNAWQPAAGLLAAELAERVLADDPEPGPDWSPSDADPQLADLLGVWWWRGIQYLAEVRDGRLRLRRAVDVFGEGATRYRPDGPDRFVGLDGPDLGEQLVVHRAATGEVTHLDMASWLLTRDPDDPRTV